MSQHPQIRNPQYNEMSFEDIEKIREKLAAGEQTLGVTKHQLLLYLNQMDKKYSNPVKWLQFYSFAGIAISVVMLFINWMTSPFLYASALVAGSYSRKLAGEYIFRQCQTDYVFLKFALAVGLVTLEK